jgi:STAS domain
MSQDQTIKLSSNLDLEAAKELLDRLKAANAKGAFTIDASGVEMMSLPGVQIMLSAVRSQTIAAVQEPSVAFISAFADHGIDWEAESANLAGSPSNGASQASEAPAAAEPDAPPLNAAPNEFSQSTIPKPCATC